MVAHEQVDELERLSAQVVRKRQLAAMRSELRRQQAELRQRVQDLEAVKLEEQADVERLEGGSLAAFFYGVIGKRDEKLTQERQEAYAARVKYDAAARALAEVEEDLRRKEDEDRRLQGCEEAYAQALARKAAALKAAGGETAEALLDLEERLAFLQSQERELEEAVDAGTQALAMADGILRSLESAEGWATWDLFGGGLVADLVKHGHLDEAQAAVEDLQIQLGRFRTELADVTIQADVQVSIDGFLRFADYFFDGLFADWAVLDQIGRSQEQVRQTWTQIDGVLTRLEALRQAAERERADLTARRDALIRSAARPGAQDGPIMG